MNVYIYNMVRVCDRTTISNNKTSISPHTHHVGTTTTTPCHYSSFFPHLLSLALSSTCSHKEFFLPPPSMGCCCCVCVSRVYCQTPHWIVCSSPPSCSSSRGGFFSPLSLYIYRSNFLFFSWADFFYFSPQEREREFVFTFLVCSPFHSLRGKGVLFVCVAAMFVCLLLKKKNMSIGSFLFLIFLEAFCTTLACDRRRIFIDVIVGYIFL